MNQQRKVLLCTDDYGISPGINQAILSLAEQGKISAVSCMSVSAYFEEAAHKIKHLHPSLSLGLHLTLTYLPALSTGQKMVPEVDLLKQTWLRQIDVNWLRQEMEMQFQRYVDVFGMPPDFVDGHQHVHVLPIIRDIFFELRQKYAPNSWIRNVVDIHGLEKKRLILAVMGWRFYRELKKRGIPHNKTIYGFYDYTRPQDFSVLFTQWVKTMPLNDVALCYVHPGHPDKALAEVDTVTTPREKEYQFFNGDHFAALCQQQITLVNRI